MSLSPKRPLTRNVVSCERVTSLAATLGLDASKVTRLVIEPEGISADVLVLDEDGHAQLVDGAPLVTRVEVDVELVD